MKVLVVMLLIVGIFSEVRRQALGYVDCEDDDIYGLQGHCREAVSVMTNVVEPSADCCNFVTERTSLACVCQNVVTQELENHVSMSKLAHVAAACGVALKSGTQCGSYKVSQKP
ncbi:hypothetical protein Taro_029015 [Colocasia esculenta]|uniref:Bifunctional inhibitor/plant lipid transfer protein/seed storage helical domain-containing protein n=1 Tax=Colocasia esculenta TaxID=4460 RepID=A0A843VIR9_COLES|nr:hypothetical protein [Colocasia esculenta]